MDNLEKMDKFLEGYTLPRQKQEEIFKKRKKLITTAKMETVIQKLPTNKNPGPDGFTGEFYQTLREVNIFPSETLPKTAEEGILPSHSTRPLSPG